jgi:penicillin-binding protein 1A
MARAFSIFSNQGREVNPIAIRSVEDRNGKIILDIERDIRQEQRRKGNAIQVISPQNAYVMISLLKKTVEMGTLYNPSGWGSKFTFRNEEGKNFKMPMAGKTGTSQNWADAWTVGFSPYYTTAIWFGFDKPGNSLGLSLTGSTLAGHVWADYMREIHQGFSFRDFVRPSAGLIDMTVCAKSGKLRTASCNEGEVTFPFLEGTQPVLPCDYHSGSRGMETFRHIELGSMFMDAGDIIKDLRMPVLRDESLLREIQAELRQPQRTQRPLNSGPANQLSNPLLETPQTVIPGANPKPPENQEPVAPSKPALPDEDSLEPPSFNPLLD